MAKNINLLTLNIGNPSKERAEKQAEWIDKREEDIFVLTETKNSEGCRRLEEFFCQYGYDLFTMGSEKNYYVHFPKSITNDLGVMVVSKYPIVKIRTHFSEDSIYYARMVDVDIQVEDSLVRIIGLYVPSRDISEEKVKRKKVFIEEVEAILKNVDSERCFIMGDFNILKKNHVPHYSNFFEWEYNFYDFFRKNGFCEAYSYLFPEINEYSWVGRTGNGYQYDYIFASDDVSEKIVKCEYIHETRKNGLTDHSGVSLICKQSGNMSR